MRHTPPQFSKSPPGFHKSYKLEVTVGLTLNFFVGTNKMHIKNCYLLNLPVMCVLVQYAVLPLCAAMQFGPENYLTASIVQAC